MTILEKMMIMEERNYRLAGHTFSLSAIHREIYKQYTRDETQESPPMQDCGGRILVTVSLPNKPLLHITKGR